MKISDAEQKMLDGLCNAFLGEQIPTEFYRVSTGAVIIPQNRKITKGLLRQLVKHRDDLECNTGPVRDHMRRVLEIKEPTFDSLPLA